MTAMALTAWSAESVQAVPPSGKGAPHHHHHDGAHRFAAINHSVFELPARQHSAGDLASGNLAAGAPGPGLRHPSEGIQARWDLRYRGFTAPRDASRVRSLNLSERQSLRKMLHASRSGRGPLEEPRSWAQAYLRHLAPSLEHAQVKALHKLNNGAYIAQFEQRVGGVEVFGPRLSMLIAADGTLLTVSGGLHAHTQLKTASAPSDRRGRHFVRDSRSVVADVLQHHLASAVAPQALVEHPVRNSPYSDYSWASKTRRAGMGDTIRAKAVYVPTAYGLSEAYYIEFDQVDPQSGENYALAVVALASDSTIVLRHSLSFDDSFKYRVWADPKHGNVPMDGPFVDFTPHPTGMPDGSRPKSTQRVVVEMKGFNQHADPWLPAGAKESKGNNVDAYTDRDQTSKIDPKTGTFEKDGFTEGDFRAEVNAQGDFDFPYSFEAEPNANRDQINAAVTQIFYTTNWLHDYWYDSGLDEKSGVAQQSNYGRGGLEGDPLWAQAQDSADSGKRNNANMRAYRDGKSPIMQMYVWDNLDVVRELVPTPKPDGYVGKTGTAAYGPKDFDIEADAILVKDGEAPEDDGCQAPVNDVKGKIVLVVMSKPGEASACKSILRAAELQKKGAKGMIFLSNDEVTPGLGGDYEGEITIPALALNYEEGQRLLGQLKKGALKLRMRREVSVDLDGTIDNQVVAHEWGHYAHLRNVLCQSASTCGALGEGWADYIALHMTMRPGDAEGGVYPLSVYASSGREGVDAAYYGIRRLPYSTDMKKNPFTFRHIRTSEPLPKIPMNFMSRDNAEIHNAGEIWAAALFEISNELHKVESADWNKAHRLMADYVMAGMKMAPTEPSWTEQRDALLAAAKAGSAQHYEAFLRGFAKRGFGSCAVSPDVHEKTNAGTQESFDIAGRLKFVNWALDDKVESCDNDGWLDLNETGTLTVTLSNTGVRSLKATKVSVQSLHSSVTVKGSPEISVPALEVGAMQQAKLTVRLSGAPPIGGVVPLKVVLSDEASCNKVHETELRVRVHMDAKPGASTVDTFEIEEALWTTQKLPEQRVEVWSRDSLSENDQSNYFWHGINPAERGDSSFISPAISVAPDKDFSLRFDHAYSFEASEEQQGEDKEKKKMVYWDGGVIEYSEDGKQSWKDVMEIVNPGYTNYIGKPKNESKNPLANRPAFVSKSADFPALRPTRIDFGRALAGKTVHFRFRIGSDEATGAPGWMIDNFEVIGAFNTPFTALTIDSCQGGVNNNGTGSGSGTGTNSMSTSTMPMGEDGGSDDSSNEGDGPGSSGCKCSSVQDPIQGSALAIMGLAGLTLLRRRR